MCLRPWGRPTFNQPTGIGPECEGEHVLIIPGYRAGKSSRVAKSPSWVAIGQQLQNGTTAYRRRLHSKRGRLERGERGRKERPGSRGCPYAANQDDQRKCNQEALPRLWVHTTEPARCKPGDGCHCYRRLKVRTSWSRVSSLTGPALVPFQRQCPCYGCQPTIFRHRNRLPTYTQLPKMRSMPSVPFVMSCPVGLSMTCGAIGGLC